MDKVLKNVSRLVDYYNSRQRVFIFIVSVGLILSLIILLVWSNQPEYQLLYKNLDMDTANRIVDDLHNGSIDYNLRDGGRSIYIPKDYVAECRLKTLTTGLMSGKISGINMIEKPDISSAIFTRDLDEHRLLEQELSSTINQFTEIKRSRIHLETPNFKSFGKNRGGIARAVLYLNPDVSLNRKRVNNIAEFIANSAEGIDIKNVSIRDPNGKNLFDGSQNDEQIIISATTWGIRQAVESGLQKKIYDILEVMIGPDNFVVNVSVNMNFDRIDRTTEKIDTKNTAVLSEETYKESSKNKADSSDFKSEKVTSNYGPGKEVERFISDAGSIEKISIVLLINGKYVIEETENGENVEKYEPLSDQEIERISSLIKVTVGFSEKRGDVLEIQNFKFNKNNLANDRKFFAEMGEQELWQNIIRYSLTGLSIILLFILIRTFIKSGTGKAMSALVQGQENIALSSGDNGDIPEDTFISQLSPEARAQLKSKDKMVSKIISFVQKSPSDASKLLRYWISQE